jgi:hypothetical protein
MVKTIVAMMRAKRWMRSDKDNEDEILLVIQNAPTIDCAPVVHGEWVDGMKCQYCGQVDTTKPNYCPNCGAKMDGGKNDV